MLTFADYAVIAVYLIGTIAIGFVIGLRMKTGKDFFLGGRQLLMAVPLTAVRVLFVASLVVVFVWVLRLPRSETTPPGGTTRWDENLKLGACLALALQIVIYALLQVQPRRICVNFLT